MELHSVYSSVTSFFNLARFSDLSLLLLVSAVSSFWGVFHCVTILFFYSFTCWWTHESFPVFFFFFLGYSAVMTICVSLLWTYLLNFLGKYIVVGLLGHMVNNWFNFIRNCQTCPTSVPFYTKGPGSSFVGLSVLGCRQSFAFRPLISVRYLIVVLIQEFVGIWM